jgi:hypothetical protein
MIGKFLDNMVGAVLAVAAVVFAPVVIAAAVVCFPFYALASIFRDHQKAKNERDWGRPLTATRTTATRAQPSDT